MVLGFQQRFKQRGVDESRIGKLLDGKADCRCSRSTCFRKLSRDRDSVREFLLRFYELAKLDQDEFVSFLRQNPVLPGSFKHLLSCWLLLTTVTEIRQLCGGDDERRSRRTSYQLLGVKVGFECLASVLGIGSKRLRKALAGTPDMRFKQFGGGIRATPKTNDVDKFLFGLHGTVAETLPTGWPVENFIGGFTGSFVIADPQIKLHTIFC